MLVDLPGAGSMKPTLFELLRPILEDWIGGQIPLVPSSIYGVRVYTEGSTLKARRCVRSSAVGLRRVRYLESKQLLCWPAAFRQCTLMHVNNAIGNAQ